MSSLLKWAIVCLILAGIAALFGFGNLSEGFADVAKVLFGVFLVACIALFILGLTVFKAVT